MYVLAAILASVLAAASPAQAQGSLWCYRSDKTSPVACVFPTMDQCVRSAAIMGGICERAEAGPDRPSPRRPQKQRWQKKPN